MERSILETYAAYNLWANERLIPLVAALEAEKQDQKITSSFPSLRLTVLHLWDAEEIWTRRLGGNGPADWPSNSLPPQTPVSGVLEVSRELKELVARSSDEFLSEEVSYQTLSGEQQRRTVWEIVMHVVNHGSYHRGQLVTMLRQCAVEDIPATDLIAYFKDSDKR